ncbi:MAG: CBS domain-containing protein [Chromatiales bacterium]|jgi:CBS domain-containing protein
MNPNVKAVTEDTPLMEAASLMCLYRYSGLPVLRNNELVGLIAEKDILAELFPSLEDAMQGMAMIDFHGKAREYRSLMKLSVGSLMTKNVRSLSPDMPVLKAAVIIANNRFRRMPVAESKQLVGIISLGDIHKAIFHQSLSGSKHAA